MEYIDWLNEHCPDKVVSAQKAVSRIKRGSRIFIGTGCGEPQHLIKAAACNVDMQDVVVYQMLSHTLAEFVDDDSFLNRFSIKLFFISSVMRRAAFEGKIDYIPAYLSQIPGLFASRRIPLDVAMIQVSPPDRFGYCSLGISVDITRAGMENSKLVIAQVNPRMPRTWGDSFVHVDEIDHLVLHEEPIVESLTPTLESDITGRIGHYVSQLVNDGATLQIGFGRMPFSLLEFLTGKKDLGVHTQVITDGFLPLFEKKVITNKKKTLLSGRTVASLCMGSQRLYDYVNNNPMFYFRSSEFVNDPATIARNDNLISISSALEVDLTGQVCTDSVGHLFYSGIGDQVDFLRGSAMSKGGFSIIALPSTAQGGKISRIVPHLSEGAGVATTRGDVHFVVTEYGVAELQGKSIYQRVMELTQIAHPKFREELIDYARRLHYISADQLPPQGDDLIFIEGYKSSLRLKDGITVDFRPLLPSDELAYRSFFYSLEDETILSRFFYYKKLFSHQAVQEEWAAEDYRNRITLIGLASKGGSKEIMAIGSYAQAEGDRAEAAFVVREDFQGMGIAGYLLGVLERIAKENGYKGFVASVLAKNTGMKHVFKKRYPHAKISTEGGEVYIVMDFDDGSAKSES
jgi:acyl-CoA hydrolase/GNAT superfamily N-acetyltransferase